MRPSCSGRVSLLDLLNVNDFEVAALAAQLPLRRKWWLSRQATSRPTICAAKPAFTSQARECCRAHRRRGGIAVHNRFADSGENDFGMLDCVDVARGLRAEEADTVDADVAHAVADEGKRLAMVHRTKAITSIRPCGEASA